MLFYICDHHLIIYKGYDWIILHLYLSFRYKESFSHVASRRRESVTAFNDMLVDMCDALWRNKAFSNPTQGSLKALSACVSPILCSLGISYPSSRFSIFQGQAFLSQAWNFFLKVHILFFKFPVLLPFPFKEPQAKKHHGSYQ